MPIGTTPQLEEVIECDTVDRIERPVKYRVIFKMVAVRDQPIATARSIGSKPAGEIVDMYEWDRTQKWRRVRVLASPDADGDSTSAPTEVDGWMLIHSAKLGALLQEVPEDEDYDMEEAG